VLLHQSSLLVYLVDAMKGILGFWTSLTLLLQLMLHFLQIDQILDLLLCLVEYLSVGPLCLQVVVMIVGHHLLRCLHLYFLWDWYHFFIGFAVRLPGPLPLIFMMVFLFSGLSFFLDTSRLLLFIVTTHFPIPLHDWISYFYKDIPILVLLSLDVGITLSIFVGMSLDFIYRNG
jgi:hypothetical protein